MAASQERFTTVLESLGAAVSAVPLETNAFLFANRFYRERFGDDSKGHFQLAGNDAINTTMRDIAEDLEDSPPGIPTHFLYKESEEVQLSDGSNQWFEIRCRFLFHR